MNVIFIVHIVTDGTPFFVESNNKTEKTLKLKGLLLKSHTKTKTDHRYQVFMNKDQTILQND